jgi:uncharacterized tellurite resistance protein B-like protein
MNSYEDKLSLLSEMIAFAKIDGQVHEREYRFLSIVASQLRVENDAFKTLFKEPVPKVVIKTEHQRMQADGVLHDNEQVAIREMGINMGLSPYAMKSVLVEMQQSPTGLIDPEVLLALFRAQQN